MFESIGRMDDAEAGRRGALAGALSLVVVGLAVALLLWTGARPVFAALGPRAGGDGLLMVELADPALDTPLPPPPPPPAAHSTAVHESQDMDERVGELSHETKDAVRDDASPSGKQGGVAGGEPDGTAGGTVGGDPSGQLFGGAVPFDSSGVQLKRRVPLQYPAQAAAMHLGEVDCMVRVNIDEQGIPYGVGIARCPVVFRQAIETGLRGWRWYPARQHGRPVRAQFLLRVRFVPGAG